jgi:1,4-dihydroxy-2-naphthoate octaprenyltransferase
VCPERAAAPSLVDWLGATRPRTLVAAVVPVAVGLALARGGGVLDAPVAAATLGAALLIQIATNFANDYGDFVRGADGPERLGPRRLSGAPGGAAAVRRATAVVVALAALIGLFLVARGGWPILAIGVASLAAALAYTGGPLPLAYHGLGDVFVFAFFGPVAVAGTYYLQRGALDPRVLLAAVPVGCLAVAILVVNNLRDIDGDRRAGKRTLAVRLGAAGTRVEYLLLLATAFAAALGAGVWLPLAVAPLAAREAAALWRRRGAELNASLAGTARLHLLFGALLAAGLAT